MYETCCLIGPGPHELFPFDRAKAYERSSYIPLRDELRKRIAQLCEIGVETFLTGGAQGTAQLAFWAIHYVKKEYPYIKNVVCLPFETYGDEWDSDGAFGKADRAKIRDMADKVEILSEGTPNASDVPRLLSERNQYIVEHADLVLAVSMAREFLKGSDDTAESLRLAKKQDRKIRVIHPTNGDVAQFDILRLTPWERFRTT